MSNITHGLSKHPHYRRWNSFVSRCYNPKDLAYKAYGARGICVCEAWAPHNPDGVGNFLRWVDAEIAKAPELATTKDAVFEVVRKNVDGDFSPDNCTLQAEGAGVRIRRTTVLTEELVISLRKKMKEEQRPTLEHLQQSTGVTVASLSRCLRGLSWSSVDKLEAPLKTLLPEQNIRKVIHASQSA